MKNRWKTSRKVFINYVTLLFCLFIGWLMLIILPTGARGATMDISWENILVDNVSLQSIMFTSGMVIEIIQVWMYIVVGLSVYTIFNRNDWREILYKIVKYTRWMLYFNSLEIITKYIFKSTLFHDVLDGVLGSSIATSSELYSRGTGYALCGLTKEASHYAYILVILLIFYIISFNLNKDSNNLLEMKKDLYGIVLASISMLLSMSFSSLYYAACLCLLILFIVTERKGNSIIKMWGIIFASIFAVLLIIKLLPTITSSMSLSSFWGRRLVSVVEEFEKISSGKWLYASSALEWSNRVRLGSTYETLKLVIYRPLFGLGFASTSAHSSLAMLLSGCGFVGTFCYIRCVFFTGNLNIEKRYKGLYLGVIVVFLLTTLFSSLSLRPFYEMWNLVIAVAVKEWVNVRQSVKNIELEGKK